MNKKLAVTERRGHYDSYSCSVSMREVLFPVNVAASLMCVCYPSLTIADRVSLSQSKLIFTFYIWLIILTSLMIPILPPHLKLCCLSLPRPSTQRPINRASSLLPTSPAHYSTLTALLVSPPIFSHGCSLSLSAYLHCHRHHLSPGPYHFAWISASWQHSLIATLQSVLCTVA